MSTKYGQNFLIDKNIALKIAEAAEISASDTVIEIGPGKGIITEHLHERAKKVIAVEIDKNLAGLLSEKFKHGRIDVINEDVLKVDLAKLAGADKITFVGNLPYYISTPILHKIMTGEYWKTAIFTFQKEVAERIVAKPSKKNPKNYGYLSVICTLYSESNIIMKIPPEAFFPRPKVMSAVVKFKPIFPKIIKDADTERLFFKTVGTAFAQRRKKISNSIAAASEIEKEKIIEILKQSGIPSDSRAEELGLSDFLNLTYHFKNSII